MLKRISQFLSLLSISVTLFLFVNITPYDQLSRTTYNKGTLTLTSGQILNLAGNVQLRLWSDGTFRLKKDGITVWMLNLSNNCTTDCLVAFQGDGNLVAYKKASSGTLTPIWATGTDKRGSQLVISRHSPYISVLNPSGNVLWTGNNEFESIVLEKGSSIISFVPSWDNPASFSWVNLTLQHDGNLVAYKDDFLGNSPGRTKVWSSNTNSTHCSDCRVTLQTDGNLVMYEHWGTSQQKVTWASGTFGNRLYHTSQGPRFGYVLPPFAPIFQSSNYKSLGIPGCNRAQFGNHPSMGDIFLGRQLNDELPSGGCPSVSNSKWSITVNKMDWSNNTLNLQYRLIDTTRSDLVDEKANSFRYKITQANDVTVAKVNGQYYVAFECHGEGFGDGAASCAVRMYLDPADNKYKIDKSTLSVIVKGKVEGSIVHSASVPKIVSHKGRTYIYWTHLLADYSLPNTGNIADYFLGATIVGVEVGLINGKLRAKSSSGTFADHPIDANDRSISVEVMGKDNNHFKQSVDAFQILSKGDQLMMVGAAAKTCAYPKKDTPDCYKLFFAHSKDPLLYRGFNAQVATFSGLPTYPTEYSSFIYRSSDQKTVFRYFSTQDHTNKLFEWPDRVMFSYDH